MPTTHRRIGLVLDAPMKETIHFLHQGRPDQNRDAALARRAVFHGSVFESLLNTLASGAGDRDSSLAMLRGIRSLVSSLDGPATEARQQAIEDIDRVSARLSLDVRRERQLAFLKSREPDPELALALRDDLDGFQPV